MEAQKEALSRIVTTLAAKSEEIQSFVEILEEIAEKVEENGAQAKSDLQEEFDQLYAVMNEMRDAMTARIEDEQQRKMMTVETDMQACQMALDNSTQLMDMAADALQETDPDAFSQAAKRIKDRVTMSPAFRLTLKPKVTDNMSHLVADFTEEKEALRKLDFLPAPATPEIDVEACRVEDNTVTVVWRVPEGSRVDHFLLEYRQTDTAATGGRAKVENGWQVIEDIEEPFYTILGLAFNQKYVQLRARACNKAVAGDYSDVVTLETKALNFKLDQTSCHANLKVTEDGSSVEWDAMGGKGQLQETKGRGSRPGSPAKTVRPASPAKSPAKRPASASKRGDRFTGESYTVLADVTLDEGQHYWEVTAQPECKSFTLGVAYRNLGKFDQLGKTNTSWCLHVNNWLQNTMSAKHNNKSKQLDVPIPERIGVYLDYDNLVLSFHDAETKQLLHQFKAKFQQPVLPAFMTWCGGLTVQTGLQVPSNLEMKTVQESKKVSPASSELSVLE
ncbi:FSD1 [Branchiostoma lanceolatum]|uniref:FSD1 protein n=1 Tax=Branchiostoma lanceolatum TaxID=7740 RepID=A0A8J9ZF43_BRALA|nr:FSD1 [Branchiostoma lanceolatum]